MNLTQRALLFDGGNRLPKTSLFLYLGRPNLEAADVPIGDDTEIGDDTIIRWMFLLPADADIRAATGWVSGVGNIFYDAAGDPVAVLASEIAAWSSVNQWNVLFHLVSADTETGRLAIYAQDTPLVILNKALKVLREDQIDASPSAFFNGMDFRLLSPAYLGGPTYVPDHLGVLRSPGANLPAVQGMRLEWVPSGTTIPVAGSSGSDAENYIETLATNRYRFVGDGNTVTRVYWNNLPLGKKYRLAVTDVVKVTGSLKGNNNADSDLGSITADTLVDFVVVGDTTIEVLRKNAGEVIDITATFSIQELIPTWRDTTITGEAILPSTPQKTVTYNDDWSAKTFAETFDKFDISDPLKAPGWLCEPVRTNKCICRKSNPVDTSGLTKGGDAAAVLSVVDDTAALEAAGLKLFLCTSGKVYKLNNSAGVGYAAAVIAGACANTNPHSVSIYTRVTGGTGEVKFNNAVVSTITLSEYSKLKGESINPADATKTLSIVALAGAIVYFILPDLQEGAFCTSSITTTADPLTAITRAATVASFPTAGKIPVNNFAIRMIVVPRASGQSGVYVFCSYTDENNYTAVMVGSTMVVYRKRIAGVSTEATVSITHTKDAPLQMLHVGTTSGMQVAARTYSGGIWSAWANGTLNSSTGAKANAVIASNYQLGALNSTALFTGNISLFDCVPIPSGITDPMAWAKTHWGVA